ncbi:hypothetical protein AB0L06_01510 [Spirillospora sp. NPDC052269]
MSRNPLRTASKPAADEDASNSAGWLGRTMARLGLPDALMVAGATAGGLWLLVTYLLMMSTGPAIVLSLAVGVGVFSWALAQIDRHRSRTHSSPPRPDGAEDADSQAPDGQAQQVRDA